MKTKLKLTVFLVFPTIALMLISCGGVPEESASATSSKKVFSVEEVLEMVAKENDITRTLYTKAIVGGAKPQGLNFDEDWRKDDVEAGPLPALFLRGISEDIKKGTTELGVYLGSDFPINDANKFQGKQAELFEEIKKDRKPQFFFDEKAQLHTAMFADVAGAAPCVSCHNGHEQSPKKDWQLGDVMGATTWQYPSDSLTYDEALNIIKAYRDGTKAIYNQFLEEVQGFKVAIKPEIGNKWPSTGFYIPTTESFIDSVRKMASYETMNVFIN